MKSRKEIFRLDKQHDSFAMGMERESTVSSCEVLDFLK